MHENLMKKKKKKKKGPNGSKTPSVETTTHREVRGSPLFWTRPRGGHVKRPHNPRPLVMDTFDGSLPHLFLSLSSFSLLIIPAPFCQIPANPFLPFIYTPRFPLFTLTLNLSLSLPPPQNKNSIVQRRILAAR